jgi:hypothetical protein
MLFSIGGVFNAVGQWFLPLSSIDRRGMLGRPPAGMSRAVHRVDSIPWLAVLGYCVEFGLNESAALLNSSTRVRYTVRHGAQVSGIRMAQAEEN